VGVRVQNQGYTIPTDGFPLGRTFGGTNRGPLYRTLLDSRIPMGAGTDGPLVGPMNPWLSIYYMVTGRDNSGRLVNAGETLTRAWKPCACIPPEAPGSRSTRPSWVRSKPASYQRRVKSNMLPATVDKL
jgi:hypothetical protein